MYCSDVYLLVNETLQIKLKKKYLGYIFTDDKQDDVEMLRQFRLLYMHVIKQNNTHVLFMYIRDVKL